ncbi:MAG: S-methyl-5'-thioinosine phosphorylase [Gammaproteobacteria bacterium]|nr:S-methyl-5'-thioinosine phosphorylase [Gammaproteobacteria bacterium]
MTGTRKLAIIGGSGISGIDGFTQDDEANSPTSWGQPSAPIHIGTLAGLPALYLARHGEPHALAPHRINYRANLQALADLGATDVIGLAAVGGIEASAAAGTLWLPLQLIDYTSGRDSSFSMAHRWRCTIRSLPIPYDRGLRSLLERAAEGADIRVQARGVYGCTQGPRLETAAEIARMRRDGCDLVGMTGMPEAVLARELGLSYACLAMVVNRAAGLQAQPISLQQIQSEAAGCAQRIARLLERAARMLAGSGSRG